jgi:hypothetical protein
MKKKKSKRIFHMQSSSHITFWKKGEKKKSEMVSEKVKNGM